MAAQPTAFAARVNLYEAMAAFRGAVTAASHSLELAADEEGMR